MNLFETGRVKTKIPTRSEPEMLVAELLFSWWTPLAGLVLLAACYAYPYLVTHGHLRGIPAPWPAQLSSVWLFLACRRGKRYLVVDRTHRRLGPIVRIQPNHVSINDDAAIQAVYGHGNGLVKADYYDAFVSIRRGLFNTRDRAEHARKRRIISHTFSARSVAQFEPYIHHNLETFVRQWDRLIEEAEAEAEASPASIQGEHEPMTGEQTKEAHLDCLPWFNYLAFDIIGDLAFGAPFGMLAAGADMAEVRTGPTSELTYAPAIEILNRRGEVSATLGCCPPALRRHAAWLLLPDPFFRRGLSAVRQLAGIAVARVRARLGGAQGEKEEEEEAAGEDPWRPATARRDLLARLAEGRDDQGAPLGRDELTAEALTQLIAGSDTTSNSSCALLYHVARTPRVLRRLQAELDAALPAGAGGADEDGGDVAPVPTYDRVRDLPYLSAVLSEALRVHSTSGIGLPRLVPPGSPGVSILGHHFPPGTVLSVPSYSIHHSADIWGPDADEFRPERWEAATARQKNAFIPFSHGPRACVGRNVAEMEMKLIIATWARRYDVSLRQDHLKTREGFLRKPLGLEIGIRRRR